MWKPLLSEGQHFSHHQSCLVGVLQWKTRLNYSLYLDGAEDASLTITRIILTSNRLFVIPLNVEGHGGGTLIITVFHFDNNGVTIVTYKILCGILNLQTNSIFISLPNLHKIIQSKRNALKQVNQSSI